MTYLFLIIAFTMGFTLCMFMYETGLIQTLSRDDPAGGKDEGEN